MKKKFFVSIALSTFLIFSCTKDNGGTSTGTGNNNGGSTGGGTTTNPGPLFIAVRSVLQANCAVSGCHTGTNAQNGINFSVDNTIVAQKDRIKVRAVDNAGTANQMPPPPAAPLPAADRQKITDWVNAGGKLTD